MTSLLLWRMKCTKQSAYEADVGRRQGSRQSVAKEVASMF
jgi:hypothetical protein